MTDLTTKDITRVGAGTGKVKPFSRLEAVREFLKDQAKDLVIAYRTLAMEAITQGKPEVAEKILWNLIDSMPKENGVGIVDAPASKPPKEVSSGSSAPAIQIGVMLGGMTKEPLQLPSTTVEVIDVTPRKGPDEPKTVPPVSPSQTS
jgi:hypothetical protein